MKSISNTTKEQSHRKWLKATRKPDRYRWWATELNIPPCFSKNKEKREESECQSSSHLDRQMKAWADRTLISMNCTLRPSENPFLHSQLCTDASRLVFSLKSSQCAHGPPTIPLLSMWCILLIAHKTGNNFIDMALIWLADFIQFSGVTVCFF